MFFIDVNLGSFLNKILFWVQQLFFALRLRKYLADKEGIIYSRDQFSLILLDPKQHRLYWEAHNFPRNIKSKFYNKILEKISGLVVISKGLKDDFANYYNGPITVAPDGVDIEEFDIKVNKKEAREKLGLPLDKKIIIYTGHLYKWKGADLLLETADSFQEDNLFVFVGGTDLDVRIFKEKAEKVGLANILILGHKHHGEIPLYLKAADCAVLVGKKTERISDKYTSPLKMFEYMASGCPIVAQDLPSFREVLNENNSVIVQAESPQAMYEGIKIVTEDRDLADKISRKAKEDAQIYTWRKRAEKIRQMFYAARS